MENQAASLMESVVIEMDVPYLCYAIPGQNEQMMGYSPPTPNHILMNSARPDVETFADYTAMDDGTWQITPQTIRAKAVIVENAWRETELPIALGNVTAIQFEDPDAMPGTEAQWKAYWIKLRAWKEGNADFPDMTKRPIQPS